MSDILNQYFENLLKLFDDLKQRETKDSDLAAKRKYALLVFALIKKINRSEKHKLRSERDTLQLEKVRVDSSRLQLQNLLYEVNHLKREIRRCHNFRSGDEDLNLLSQESYMDMLGLNAFAENDPLNRQTLLECELKLRKQLSSEYKELISSKKLVFQDIVSKMELLTSLPPSLRTLLKATRPLQESLQLPLDQEWKLNQLVQLLPQPLYLAYMNSYALENITNSHIRLLVKGCENIVNQMEHSGQVAQLREAVSAALGKDITNLTTFRNSSNENEKLILEPHPLSLQFSIGELKCNDGYVVINVQYFPRLHIVTAVAKMHINEADMELVPPRDILTYLYDDDVGDTVPIAGTSHKLSETGITDDEFLKYLASKEFGKPYRWLQRMCGIDVFDDDMERNNAKLRQYIEETLNSIKKIWHSRLNLFKQIKLLMNKNINTHLQDELLPATPPSCSLVQWTSITMEEYISNVVTNRYIALNFVNASQVFFRSVVVRGSAKMECFISISNQFPTESPLWAICVYWNGQYNASNSTAIKTMENWTNCLQSTDLKNPMSLLLVQLIRTMDSFDIFLETEGPNYKPSEFNKEKPFIKAFSKRIRARPFRFFKKSHANLFKQ